MTAITRKIVPRASQTEGVGAIDWWRSGRCFMAPWYASPWA
jgi:hypothetical protein